MLSEPFGQGVSMEQKRETVKLDKYEKEVLDAFENGRLVLSKTQTDFQVIAQNTLKKDRKIKSSIH